MPSILSYLVQGYVFLVAYYWISFKDNKDFTNLIVKSIATSYILRIIFDKICSWTNISFSNDSSYMLWLIGLSATSGFLIGKITTHRCFNLLLNKLHIGRTTNTNIWDDVIKPYTWVRVFMKDGSSYLGQYRYGEPFKSEPIIVLTTYQKLNKDTDVVIDHSKESNELIMINTKDFDRIEIIYTNVDKISLRKRISIFFKNKKNNKTKETGDK